MLRYKVGNIVDAPEEVLVNAVNCVGVMGAGVALAFKRRWPEMFAEYRGVCLSGGMFPGDVDVYRVEGGPVIFNAATKGHWRESSRVEIVETCARHVRLLAEVCYFSSVALPKLGCGLGGLSWDEVRPLYEEVFAGSVVDFVVYDLD